MVTPKLGVPMSPADAKAYIDALNRKVVQRVMHRAAVELAE